MDILDSIDLVLDDLDVSPDAMRVSPEPEPDPDYCDDCGHYGGCYAPGISCGDIRCCQP